MNISGQTFVRWLFWPAWVFANILAILAGYGIGSSFASVAAWVDIQATDRIISMVMVPATGLAFGLFQWLVIRLRFPLPGIWILATFLGWIIPILLLLVSPLVPLLNSKLGIILILTAIGLGTGLAQYLIFRSMIQRAGWWIVGSLMGWLILGSVLETPITNLWGIVIVGAVPAIVTGFFLAWIITEKPHPFSSELA